MVSFQDRLALGARNLLVNCGQCAPGDTLLLVQEAKADGYYDPELGPAIRAVATHLGLTCDIYHVPFQCDVSDPDATLTQKMNDANCTLFLARMGDQIRFRPADPTSTQVISYALDRQALASAFGTIDYQVFDDLKALINAAVAQSSQIEVTCPAGTHFVGHAAAFAQFGADTTRKRFPVSVFAPVPAQGFSGCIAQKGFLTGTGSHYYAPWSCKLDDTLFVRFQDNRIIGFDGTASDVAAAKAHYEFVGNSYGIDTYYVHSWHAGIHPGCAYRDRAGHNFERWSGSAFGNPRLLHFHTCGAYPPGEISLNVLDPTVKIDGRAVWDKGRLYPDRIAGAAALLAPYPEVRALFDTPETEVGQGASGQLAFA